MARSPKMSIRALYVLILAFASLYFPGTSHLLAAYQVQSTMATPPAEPPIRFEIASIRPHRFAGDEPSNRRVLSGGRFVATATTVRTLLRIAFNTDENLMSGAPSWVDGETFDIDAITADHAEIKTPQQLQQLILSLLEDRFQLKFHREQKEGAVYWLELESPGKLGPSLKLSTPESQTSMSTNSNGSTTVMKVSKMSMTDIAGAFRRQAGRPVEDHTGVKGSFDFQIEWAAQETQDSADPSFSTVLKEQLGLKLQSAKGPIVMFVIDQIARPSAN